MRTQVILYNIQHSLLHISALKKVKLNEIWRNRKLEGDKPTFLNLGQSELTAETHAILLGNLVYLNVCEKYIS